MSIIETAIEISEHIAARPGLDTDREREIAKWAAHQAVLEALADPSATPPSNYRSLRVPVAKIALLAFGKPTGAHLSVKRVHDDHPGEGEEL